LKEFRLRGIREVNERKKRVPPCDESNLRESIFDGEGKRAGEIKLNDENTKG